MRRGALIREYRGVYRVGHRAPSVEATYLAAVKACGDGSLLCGLAAAHLHGLIKGKPPPPQVLTPTERRVKGLRTRQSRHIDKGDATKVRGIPVTAVARTLVDIAPDRTEDELARACHEAGVRYKIAPRHVDQVLERRPTSPGAGKLRRIMRGDVQITLSPLEKRFLRLLGAEGLPLPKTNREAGRRRVDCRWPDHRLTVELDSYTFHNSRHSWEQDRRREREAHVRGDQFRRYTRDDVFEHPELMLAELRQLLG